MPGEEANYYQLEKIRVANEKGVPGISGVELVAEVEYAIMIQGTGSRMPYFPMVVKKGYGSIIEDIDGNKYIDNSE